MPYAPGMQLPGAHPRWWLLKLCFPVSLLTENWITHPLPGGPMNVPFQMRNENYAGKKLAQNRQEASLTIQTPPKTV